MNDQRNPNGTLMRTGDPQDTNVAQLYRQVAGSGNSNTQARYYAGPGGDPSNGNGLGTAMFAEGYTRQQAEAAYLDMFNVARLWLKENPGGELTASMTAFSRGGASAAYFSQLLYEKGLVHPDTGEVLVQPVMSDNL